MDMPELPDFLKRTKGEKTPPAGPATVYALPPSEEKWRRLEGERRTQKKIKARGRVAKMLAVKSDRDAVAQGKTWDVQRGGWR